MFSQRASLPSLHVHREHHSTSEPKNIQAISPTRTSSFPCPSPTTAPTNTPATHAEFLKNTIQNVRISYATSRSSVVLRRPLPLPARWISSTSSSASSTLHSFSPHPWSLCQLPVRDAVDSLHLSRISNSMEP